jgi:hypothetical protein
MARKVLFSLQEKKRSVKRWKYFEHKLTTWHTACWCWDKLYLSVFFFFPLCSIQEILENTGKERKPRLRSLVLHLILNGDTTSLKGERDKCTQAWVLMSLWTAEPQCLSKTFQKLYYLQYLFNHTERRFPADMFDCCHRDNAKITREGFWLSR